MADTSSAQSPESGFIHAPIEAIYKAFVEPAELKVWLGLDLDIMLELGGIYRLTDSEGSSVEGAIEVVAWPEALSVAFDDGRFELGLAPEFGGTRVTFESHGLKPLEGAIAKLEAYLARPGRR